MMKISIYICNYIYFTILSFLLMYIYILQLFIQNNSGTGTKRPSFYKTTSKVSFLHFPLAGKCREITEIVATQYNSKYNIRWLNARMPGMLECQ